MVDLDRLDVIAGLPLRRLSVRFFASDTVQMEYWIGAVLRNRFLYASDMVTWSDGKSLRHIIDTMPLSETHFLYTQYVGGFPKGFVVDFGNLPFDSENFVLESNRVYSFSIVLIGTQIRYVSLYEEAIRRMLAIGFGHPIVSFQLIDIVEEDVQAKTVTGSGCEDLRLLFKTPVSLISQRLGNCGNGFQNKMNNFPSLYQFMRSLTYRIVALGILYDGMDIFSTREQMDGWIEEYISATYLANLLLADIVYEKRRSTPKAGRDSVYSMGGYVGKMLFANVPVLYGRLLDIGSVIGVGANVSYGLGQYKYSFSHG